MNKHLRRTLIAAAGACLIAAAALAQSSFNFLGPIARIITPNGDGLNDTAIFCVDNPAFSDVQGKIYTLLGTEVAALGPLTSSVSTGMNCPVGVLPNSSQYLTWDGRSNGSVVRSGVYVYRIQAESRIYAGTIVVAR